MSDQSTVSLFLALKSHSSPDILNRGIPFSNRSMADSFDAPSGLSEDPWEELGTFRLGSPEFCRSSEQASWTSNDRHLAMSRECSGGQLSESSFTRGNVYDRFEMRGETLVKSASSEHTCRMISESIFTEGSGYELLKTGSVALKPADLRVDSYDPFQAKPVCDGVYRAICNTLNSGNQDYRRQGSKPVDNSGEEMSWQSDACGDTLKLCDEIPGSSASCDHLNSFEDFATEGSVLRRLLPLNTSSTVGGANILRTCSQASMFEKISSCHNREVGTSECLPELNPKESVHIQADVACKSSWAADNDKISNDAVFDIESSNAHENKMDTPLRRHATNLNRTESVVFNELQHLDWDVPFCMRSDMTSPTEDLVSPREWPNANKAWVDSQFEIRTSSTVTFPINTEPSSSSIDAMMSEPQIGPLDLTIKRKSDEDMINSVDDETEMQPLDLSTRQYRYDERPFSKLAVTRATPIWKRSDHSQIAARAIAGHIVTDAGPADPFCDTATSNETAMDLTVMKSNFTSTNHCRMDLSDISDELSSDSRSDDENEECFRRWPDNPQNIIVTRHGLQSMKGRSTNPTAKQNLKREKYVIGQSYQHKSRVVKRSPWTKNHRIYEKKMAVVRRETNSTKRVTDWSVGIFREWRRSKAPFENIPSLLNMSVHEINTQLCRFLVEIRKVDGTPYPPKSLQALGQGLLRYVRSNIEHVKLEEVEIGSPDNMFKPINQVLSIEMKRYETGGSSRVSKKRQRVHTRHQDKTKLKTSSSKSNRQLAVSDCTATSSKQKKVDLSQIKWRTTIIRDSCNKKGTKWATGLFDQWSKSFLSCSFPPLENMDVEQMDSSVSVFIREIAETTISVAALPSIGYALVRHLRNHRRFDMDLMDLQDDRFSQIHQTFRDLGVRMKQRRVDHKAMLEEEACQVERSNELPTETRSTMKATMWAVRVFDKWRQTHSRERIPPLLAMSMDQIMANVTRFIREARRSDGSYFPTNSLPFLTQGLIRHVRKNPCVGNNVKPIQTAVRIEMKTRRLSENGGSIATASSQPLKGGSECFPIPITVPISLDCEVAVDPYKAVTEETEVTPDDEPAIQASSYERPMENPDLTEPVVCKLPSTGTGRKVFDSLETTSPATTPCMKARVDGMKESTDKNTKWALHMYQKWRLCHQNENRLMIPELEAMSVEDVNKHLANMVTDVVKSDGSNYTSSCVYSLACGILRHLRIRGREDLDFMNTKDKRFEAFQAALFCRMKELDPAEPKERPKIQTLALLSETKERKLWQDRIFGNKSAKNLQYTLFYYNFKLFGVKGFVTHKNLQCKQFEVGEDEEGKFIEYHKLLPVDQLQTTAEAKTFPHTKYHETDDSPVVVDLYKGYLSSLKGVGSFYRRLVGSNGPVMKFSGQTIGIRSLQYVWSDICKAVSRQQ